MGKRLVGLDYGRGLAIMGLLFTHSIMGSITHWKIDILFDLAGKIPVILVVLLLAPIALLGMMGSLFSFATAICVTLSSIKIHEKGWKYLIQYCVMKMVFAFILKGLEDFWSQICSDYNLFRSGKLEFPTVYIFYWAHTLDDVGFFSWSVPLLVAIVTSIPKMHYYGHMAILTVIAVVLLYFNQYFIEWFKILADFSKEKEFYLFYYLFMKCADGAFAIAQYFPFGILGGAYGLMMSKTRDFKVYWTYTGILSFILFLGFIRFVPFEEDIISRSFGWIKPNCFLFLMGIIQSIAVIICLHFTDNPKRDINKRYSAIKKTAFLRRINCLSLTAYVVDRGYNDLIYRIFKLFFGPGADYDKKSFLWPWYLAVLYMIVCVWVWSIIVKLWEKIEFRFCVESQLSTIMCWLFNQPYNKMDYKTAIYGPINDIQQEIEAMNQSKQDIEAGKEQEIPPSTDIPESNKSSQPVAPDNIPETIVSTAPVIKE